MQDFMQDGHGTRIPDKNVVFAEISGDWPLDIAATNGCHIAVSFMRRVPKEVTNPCLDLYSRKHVVCHRIVHQFAHVTITKH